MVETREAYSGFTSLKRFVDGCNAATVRAVARLNLGDDICPPCLSVAKGPANHCVVLKKLLFN